MVSSRNGSVNPLSPAWMPGPRHGAQADETHSHRHVANTHPVEDWLEGLRLNPRPEDLMVSVRAFMHLLLDTGVDGGVELEARLQQLQAVVKSRYGVRLRIDVIRREFAQAVARREPAAAGHSAATADGGPDGWVGFDDPPVGNGVIPPPGYRVVPEGVFLVESGWAGGGRTTGAGLLIPTPLVIAGRLIDAATQQESVVMKWRRDGLWKLKVVGRAVAANKNKLIDLAADGLPVTCDTSGGVVKYLAAFEAANIDRLPLGVVSHSLGWVSDRQAFLWGRTLIRPADDGAAGGPAVQFQGADEGDEQIAAGFQASGSWEGWRDAVTPFLSLPKVRLAVTTSLVPPLLPLMDATNFIMEYSGDTSMGKTAALRTAASCWGNPDEKAPNAAIGTWDATRVAAERMLAVLKNIPLILDDTRRAKDAEMVGRIIYDVANGRGRGRGSLKGMQGVSTWGTVLLSSGESSVNDFAEKGGAKARVISLWGTPFGGVSGETGERVKVLQRSVLAHHGHAGPRFVRFLLDRRGEWEAWRARYERAVSRYVERAADNPVLNRMADSFGLLALAGELAAEALDIPQLAVPAIDELWAELTGEVSQADVPTRALRYVQGWATAHQAHFFRNGPSERGARPQPHDGWAGRWDVGSQWEVISFFPQRLDQILQAAQFEPLAVIRSWKARNWLRLAVDGGLHCVRAGGSRMRMVSILRTALEALDPTSPSDPETVTGPTEQVVRPARAERRRS